MIFNVSTLLGEPVGSSRRHALSGAPEPALPARPLGGAAQLTRTATGILVSAQLTVEADLACARCLQPFRRPLEIAFDEEYVPERDPATGLPPAGADPDAFRIDPRQHLDLTEAIRQYGQAALPISPRCREECAGLCPRCGADRNESPCGCSGQDEDPRWGPLAAIASAWSQKERPRGSPEA